MREICQILGVDKLHTTFYKASTNAAIERFHRTLNAMIGKIVDEKQSDWDLLLPYVMAAYRSSRHDATGYTPNYLFMGREVRAPIDLVLGTGELPVTIDSYGDFVETTRNRMREAYDLVRSHLGEAAVRNKRYYDMRVRPAEYHVGQWVYYFNPRRHIGRQDKWSRKYTGPFCVTRVLGPVNVELQFHKRSKPFVVHIDKVKPFNGTPPSSWLPVQSGLEHPEEAVVTPEPEAETPINEEEDRLPDVEVETTPYTSNLPVESPSIDVITFDSNQEFRRTRPRRNIRPPARYRL